MKTFELSDQAGNITQVTILDDTTIERATEIMTIDNFLNEGNSFSKQYVDRYFIFNGFYFYSHPKYGYVCEYSNQSFDTPDMEVMLSFIVNNLVEEEA